MSPSLIRILLITAIFCMIYGYRLNYPGFAYFDEMVHVPAAKELATLSNYTQYRHPPLCHIIMAGFIKILGDHPWVWRLPSLIFAGLSTGLAGYLASLITLRTSTFWFVVSLLMMDGLWITQSRIALPNAEMIFFILASIICWLKGHRNNKYHTRYWTIAFICAAFAGSCKWQGFLVLLVPILFYIFSPHERITLKTLPKNFYTTRLLLIPLIYSAIFSFLLLTPNLTLKDILAIQFEIPRNHLFLTNIHRDASLWITWPFLIRPVWFGTNYHFQSMPENLQIIDGILCIGNPFIFALFIPALIYIFHKISKRSNAYYILIPLGLFVFWIPSFLIGKAGLFNHFYPALPFMIISIAIMIEDLLSSNKDLLSVLGITILILIILGFCFFFPLWTAIPISYQFLMQHLWLPSWH